MKRTKVIVSDVHVGAGHRKGRPNAFDDFVDDDRFAQLVGRVAQQYGDGDLELVINGDFFDLLKVPVNGLFPEAITESIGALKLSLCLRGHPKVVETLRNFIKVPNRKIVYLPGNHDMEFVFPEVRRVFCRAVTGSDTDERVRFIVDRDHYRLEGGIEIHHGHQFEALNAFDWKQLVIEKGLQEPILNLPWGSLFVLQVINKMKEERPYLDKVKPLWPLFAGGMIVDTRFTSRTLLNAAYYFLRARVSPLWSHRRPFQKLGKFLRNDLNLFDNLERNAERLFKNDPTLRAVVMGHTHTEMVRSFGRGEKVYINTGTWVPMVNLGIENLGQNNNLHYALIRYPEKGEARVSLMRWYGKRPTQEEVYF